MIPIRLILRYTAATAMIALCRPLRGPVPALRTNVTDDTGGMWIEVLDRNGMAIHRVPLADPSLGREAFGEDQGFHRIDLDEHHFVSLELPWPGNGARLRVHNGDAASVIADLMLEPEQFALPFGADAPPQPIIRPIWGHDNPAAKVLAFFAEGFAAADMPAFRAVVDSCVEEFEVTDPFQSMLDAFAVAEVATISVDRGIEGTVPRDTWFRGHFQSGSLDRVIVVDQQIAAAALNASFARSAVAMIVANTSKYGGSGGVATVFSCHPEWSPKIAIHELGHSLFGLADEYDAAGQAASLKPVEINVSGGYTSDTLKWFAAVEAGTPLPTLRKGEPEPEAKPLGAYEGAKYVEEGYYRAEYDCAMRTPGKPFCRICSAEIERILEPHRRVQR
jgi:IgA Peptidase M64